MSDPKNTIIQEFSTFCSLQDGRGGFSRKPDRKLERVIEASIGDRPPKVTKDAWARYFLLGLRQRDSELLASLKLTELSDLSALVERLVELAPDPNLGVDTVDRHIIERKSEPEVAKFLASSKELSRQFLCAYLQKIAFFVARDFFDMRIKESRLKHKYPLEECMQMAQMAATEPAKLLRIFDFQLPQSTIRAYANKKIWGCVHDGIRGKDIQAKTKSFSDWGLLKKTNLSKRELYQAIELGRKNWQNQYRLVWECYNEIYSPRQSNYSRLPDPTEFQLQQIAHRYNQRRKEFEITETIEPKETFAHLKELAQYIRELRYKKFEISYENNENLLESLSSHKQDLLSELISRESTQEVRSIIENAFAELPNLEKTAIQLWQGLGLNQTELFKIVGAQLNISTQSKMSRKIDSFLQPVLKAIEEWSVENSDVEIEPLHLERVMDRKKKGSRKKGSTKALKKYLSQSCRNEFERYLETQWQQLEPNAKELLRRNANRYWYEGEETKQSIEAEFEPVELEQAEFAQVEVDRTKALLLNNFKREIEQQLNIKLGESDSVKATLTAFVETWLQNRGTLKG